MGDGTPVDDWLSRWEGICEAGDPVSPDEFVARHCPGAAPEHVAAFLSQARALGAVGRHLGLDTDPSGGSAGTGGGPDASGQGFSDLSPGAEPVSGYRLEAPLGRGGFGEVWWATAPGGLPVALKFVRLAHRVGETERRALELIRRVRHPNLLAVSGAWEAGPYLVVAMELADRTLADRFREAVAGGGPGIPRDELLDHLADAARGLDCLHEPRELPDGRTGGIQHRDVKPQNLLLSGGGVKVADFGLARCLEGSVTSHTGGMSHPFAAPEFFNGQTSTRSDQYSLAVTYCQLRGGRLPFTGTAGQLMKGHLHDEPDLSAVPADERPALRRALAKTPADRWPSCREFVAALRQAAADADRREREAGRLAADERASAARAERAAALRVRLEQAPADASLRRDYLAVRTPELRRRDARSRRTVRGAALAALLGFAACGIPTAVAVRGTMRSSGEPGVYGYLFGTWLENQDTENLPSEALLAAFLPGVCGGLIGWAVGRVRRGTWVAAVAEAAVLAGLVLATFPAAGGRGAYALGLFGAVNGAVAGAAGGLVARVRWCRVRAELGPLPPDAPADPAAARRLYLGE